MARTRKLSPERKAFINGLIEHYHPEDAQDVQEMLKDLLGDTLQGMLEAEMDEKLGYSKYDYKNKENNGKNLYEGKENPTGLNLPEGREDINVCFIANGLLQINTPQSLQGRNISVYDINGRILKQDVCKGGLQLLSIQKGDSQGVIFIQVDGKTFKRMH